MTKPVNPHDLLWGVPEIAEYIKRSYRSAYQLISSGKIPVQRLGGRTIVVRASDLDRFFSNPTTTSSKKSEPRPPRRLCRVKGK